MDNQAKIPDLANLKRLAENAENTYAELCESGGDDLADAWDKAELEFVDAANSTAVLAVIAEIQSLRKDAERYRWFRDHSIQIVHTSTISWAFHLDKLIDEAMSDISYHPIRNKPCYEAGELRIATDLAEGRFEGELIDVGPSAAQTLLSYSLCPDGRRWLRPKKGRGGQ